MLPRVIQHERSCPRFVFVALLAATEPSREFLLTCWRGTAK